MWSRLCFAVREKANGRGYILKLIRHLCFFANTVTRTHERQHADYYYMSPPAGDIYCFSLRVCPSVRPCVRPFVCNAFLIRAISPRAFRANNLQKKMKNNIPTEVVQQKIKIQFCPKFWKFWPKNHFLDLCFIQARSR